MQLDLVLSIFLSTFNSSFRM